MAKQGYIESSGNVFADLGLPNSDELLAKAELAIRITDILRHRHLTQVQAAAILGIDQPKVSALIRGRLSGFSIERLLRFLLLLGADVSITIRPHGYTYSPPRAKASRRDSKIPKVGILTVSELSTSKTARNLRTLQAGG
jgi:predicted XRE-type DNA-binding protein